MVDITEEAQDLVEDAIGRNSPVDQMIAAIVLGAFIVMTSSIGLVGTLLLAPLAFAMAGVGLLRLWDPIDSYYPLS